MQEYRRRHGDYQADARENRRPNRDYQAGAGEYRRRNEAASLPPSINLPRREALMEGRCQPTPARLHQREALMEGRCQPTPGRLHQREACPRVGPVPQLQPGPKPARKNTGDGTGRHRCRPPLTFPSLPKRKRQAFLVAFSLRERLPTLTLSQKDHHHRRIRFNFF